MIFRVYEFQTNADGATNVIVNVHAGTVTGEVVGSEVAGSRVHYPTNAVLAQGLHRRAVYQAVRLDTAGAVPQITAAVNAAGELTLTVQNEAGVANNRFLLSLMVPQAGDLREGFAG